MQTNSSRHYLEALLTEIARALPPGARVLDAGAGDCQHARFFSAARYESADAKTTDKPYGELDYVCDLAALPVEEGRYHAVICTQVLEHIPEPRAVLDELYRVLEPGGRLVMTLPLFYAEHEAPYDFYRFTRYGIQHLLAASGFEIERIEWLEGYLGTLSYQVKTAAEALRGPRGAGRLLAAPLRLALERLSGALGYADTRRKLTTTGMCKNYAVIARKPASVTEADARAAGCDR